MYERILCNDTDTRRFTIRSTRGLGWEVRDESGGTALKAARYADWHRVERAMRVFAREAEALRERGWMEATADGLQSRSV